METYYLADFNTGKPLDRFDDETKNPDDILKFDSKQDAHKYIITHRIEFVDVTDLKELGK